VLKKSFVWSCSRPGLRRRRFAICLVGRTIPRLTRGASPVLFGKRRKIFSSSDNYWGAPPHLVFARTRYRGRKLILITLVAPQNREERAPYDLSI
jgi:hypothetical protein